MTGVGIVALALLSGGAVLAGIWHICLVSMRQELQKRELEHAERLRAIECGYVLPQDKATNPGLAIAIGVPSSVFGCAFVASIISSQAVPFVWPAAGAVGIAAVICGTILATRQPHTGLGRPGPLNQTAGKSAFPDPDAFDVVSRRG